jgi:flagellar basal-body rod modification protein FlgD
MTTPVASVGYPASTNATTNSSVATTATPAKDRSELSAQAFLQLLVAQLKYQDPSKPVDTASLMSQTATINQIQTMQTLSEASTAQLKAQQLQTAAGLVGRTVGYLDPDGVPVSGYVSAATLSDAPTVRIGTTDVALSAITQILTTPNTP